MMINSHKVEEVEGPSFRAPDSNSACVCSLARARA